MSAFDGSEKANPKRRFWGRSNTAMRRGTGETGDMYTVTAEPKIKTRIRPVVFDGLVRWARAVIERLELDAASALEPTAPRYEKPEFDPPQRRPGANQ
jgi:hypothetical protein